MNNEQLNAFIEPLLDICQAASDSIMEYYETSFSVERKNDHTPLTEADLAAHEIIKAGLQKLTPDIPILSEEDANIPFSERQSWQRYWLVDPLDGTREFIKRNGEFTVNIALVNEHEVDLGIIYVPVSGVCYYAVKNGGAYKQTPSKAAKSINTRKADLEKVVIAGSRSHPSPCMKDFLDKLPVYEVIPMGSSLKSCMVAEGSADIYPRLGPTSEWDTAAAQCIVEEAGGCILTTDFQPLRYNTKDELLNPHFIVIGDRSFNWSEFFPDRELDEAQARS